MIRVGSSVRARAVRFDVGFFECGPLLMVGLSCGPEGAPAF